MSMHNYSEEPAETAKTEVSLIKGDIVYAMIAGAKERVAVLNIPEGEDIASVYILSSPKNENRLVECMIGRVCRL